MSARVWTVELIDELKRLRRLGRTFGEIARRLGVSRSAAIGKAMRLGLSGASVASPRMQAKPPVEEPAVLGLECEVVERGLCRWIHGDMNGAWRMCGHQAVRRRSWCAHHLARVFECMAPSADVAGDDRDAA